MSPMRLIILLVAAGAAIAAVFLVRSIQTPAPAAAGAAVAAVKQAVPAKQVLVARHDIPIGKFVTAEDLRWQAWPENSPTTAFVEQTKEPEALEKMVGAVARFTLVEGEPITATKMVHAGESSFMAALLNPGMRAVSIEIAPETAAGGFILPNDRVDVIITRDLDDTPSGGGANTIQKVRSDLILANIRVLAIDGIYGPPVKEGENQGQGAALVGTRATLELTDRDSTLINAAKKAGELALSLRSISDLQAPSGATGYGRVYRDGVAQGSEGVRVYRFGTETVTSTPAG